MALVAGVPPVPGQMLALGQTGSDVAPPLARNVSPTVTELLAVHESEPLPMLLRRVNKDSDNEWAERVLETVGAEVLGGAPTTAKGVRVLRDALAELGMPRGTGFAAPRPRIACGPRPERSTEFRVCRDSLATARTSSPFRSWSRAIANPRSRPYAGPR